jgi:hypothetical protein
MTCVKFTYFLVPQERGIELVVPQTCRVQGLKLPTYKVNTTEVLHLSS